MTSGGKPGDAANSAPGTAAKVVELQSPGFIKTWTATVQLDQGDAISDLHLCDDALHVTTQHCFDHSLDPGSGSLNFFNAVTTADGHLHGGPIVLKEALVYLTDRTVEVYSRKGRLKRSIPMSFTITSGGAGYGDFVFFGEDHQGGRMAEVDVTAPYNPVRWEMTTFGAMNGAPAVVGNTVFCGSSSGSVWAMSTERVAAWVTLDGFKFKTDGKILADMRGDKFGVFAASADGRLYVLNANKGKLIWQYFADGPLMTAPEITADSVYQYIEGTGIVALAKTEKMPLDTPDHRVLDEKPLHVPIWTAPQAKRFLAESRNYAIVLSDDNRIQALDRATGKVAFQTTRNDFTAVATNLKDDVVYAATADGTVMAIKAAPIGATGELVDSAPVTGMHVQLASAR